MRLVIACDPEEDDTAMVQVGERMLVMRIQEYTHAIVRDSAEHALRVSFNLHLEWQDGTDATLVPKPPEYPPGQVLPRDALRTGVVYEARDWQTDPEDTWHTCTIAQIVPDESLEGVYTVAWDWADGQTMQRTGVMYGYPTGWECRVPREGAVRP